MTTPRWSPWTPWLSVCKPPPQLTDVGPLPTRGHAHGHVHQASKRRVHRGTSNSGNGSDCGRS